MSNPRRRTILTELVELMLDVMLLAADDVVDDMLLEVLLDCKELELVATVLLLLTVEEVLTVLLLEVEEVIVVSEDEDGDELDDV